MIIGSVMVLAKRVTDDLPFYAGWQPVNAPTVDAPTRQWTVKRPRVYKRGGKGIHFKIQRDTFKRCT